MIFANLQIFSEIAYKTESFYNFFLSNKAILTIKKIRTNEVKQVEN